MGIKGVFVADLGCSSASGRQRLWAMQQCGVEVTVVNKGNYASPWGRWGGRLAKALQQPRMMWDGKRLGGDLLRVCSEVQPDLVWFEWPREINVRILGELKKLACHPLLVSFQDDNPWGDRHRDQWMWKDYFKVVPEFDVHIVKRESDGENLGKLGATNCKLWEHGVYSPLFHPESGQPAKKYPISFVGTCFDGRGEFFEYLLKNEIPVHIFGTHWDQRTDLPRRYPANFHPAVRAEQYAAVLRNSQISLGLVSKSNYDEWTMRTFEIVACGSLLLAERTPAHERMFENNLEAIFFRNQDECIRIIKGLLSNPSKCAEISLRATRKILGESWQIESRMGQLLTSITNRR